MFNLRVFIKNGFIAAVGKMADYQIILNAAGWFEKGVLSEADLAEIQEVIDEKNARLEAEETAKAEETEITEDLKASEDVNANTETDADIESN